MPLSAGEILNERYRIVKILGQGGFGSVYRAWDLRMEGPVALKEGMLSSPSAEKQFEVEARLLFSLRHPNLPRVFDYFTVPDWGHYLVMDFIEGEDLSTMLDDAAGPLPIDKVLDWIGQVCDALIYLHAQTPPIIHRDVKPSNIRIAPAPSSQPLGSSTTRAYLVDFGIAKVFDPSAQTMTGARAVTPGYSPPEQFGYGMTDARSDVYALGATAYHSLTGRKPPPAMDITAESAPPPMPAHELNPEVPQAVSEAIARAMRLSRSARWESVAEFKQALFTTPADISEKSTLASQPSSPLSAVQPAQAVVQPFQSSARAPEPAAQPPAAPEEKKKSRPVVWIVILIILCLLALCILIILRRAAGAAMETWPLQALLLTNGGVSMRIMDLSTGQIEAKT